MISIDTNILYFHFAGELPQHSKARNFIDSLHDSAEVMLSEFMLAELYVILRNPVLLKRPLSSREAVDYIKSWRAHPRWRVVGFPGEDERVHSELWRIASQPNFAAGRIYDARMAVVLRAFGVTDFATANVKDFQDLGFRRVWNPLSD